MLDAGDDLARLRELLRDLSADATIGGVIVQQPLPVHLDLRRAIVALDPRKDIDGIHPLNAGLVSRGHLGFAPSCAEAALVLLRTYEIPLAGRQVVVIGRSNVVGRPAQLLLIREHATVTVCHRQTVDLRAELKRAEVVVAAAGVATPRARGRRASRRGPHRLRHQRPRGRLGRRGCRPRLGFDCRVGRHAGAGRRRAGDERRPDGSPRASRPGPGRGRFRRRSVRRTGRDGAGQGGRGTEGAA